MKTLIVILLLLTNFASADEYCRQRTVPPSIVCGACENYGASPQQSCRVIDGNGNVTSTFTQGCTLQTNCGGCKLGYDFAFYTYEIFSNGKVIDSTIFRCDGGVSSCNAGDNERQACERARASDGRCN